MLPWLRSTLGLDRDSVYSAVHGYNPGMKQTAMSLWDSVLQTDREAAIERVRRLRASQPKASRERLHRQLLGTKCVQVGVIGALTAIVEALPGLGRIARFTLGPLVDTTLVSALQAELVIETFALYHMPVPEHGEKIAVLAIAATNLGADQVAKQASQWISRRAGRLLGTRLLDRAWPIAKIATAATTHVALTYHIGKRSQALCQIRDARIADWPTLFKRVVKIDQRAITDWATSSLKTAFDRLGQVAGGLTKPLLGVLQGELQALESEPSATPALVPEPARAKRQRRASPSPTPERKAGRRPRGAKASRPKPKPRAGGS